MGSLLDKPNTNKENETGEGNGLKFAVSSMQGWRPEMEDAHCAVVGLNNLPDWSFFAIFDGHAGRNVSALCAKHLLESILQTDDFKESAIANNLTEEQIEKAKLGIKDGFLQLDDRMKKFPELESGDDRSGSTVVCALISSKHFFFANCGDSRAVLSRGGEAFFCTEDHKPINPAERERIQNAGGSVMIQRVNGSLAVSRALGDYEYKQCKDRGPCEQLVSPEPEITVRDRDNEKDEFLILACDGIWDVITNSDLCDFVRYQLKVHSDVETICNSIIDLCFYKGSQDNMSVILVVLPGAPTVDEKVQQADQKLNKAIEKQTRALLKENPKMPIFELITVLQQNFKSQLPPGGAIECKQSLIYQISDEIRGEEKK